jgi:nicotinamide phosphoribosyltransferase
MRGMSSLETAMMSGGAFLTSFKGTDTIPAIDFLEEYYGANEDNEVIGKSICATEHAVACMLSAYFASKHNGDLRLGELTHYEYLLTKVCPTGPISIVSDTWDYWQVLTDFLPSLKDIIMGRNGKLAIRPDSGAPVKIVCGDPDSKKEWEKRGSIQLLWETFGGTVNSKGYKQLDPHIGLIYGDGMSLERVEQILYLLEKQGFSSTNVVFGVGSYALQYHTRDDFSQAMKATAGSVAGEFFEIFKNPATDDGTKISAKGYLCVLPDVDTGELKLVQQVSSAWKRQSGYLKTVFLNGSLIVDYTLSEVREKIASQL